MIEQDAINAILRDRFRRSTCIPRYTPNKWWECDVFEITKAGYFREYEVKLSRSDFLADAKKFQEDVGYDRIDGKYQRVIKEHRVKHDLLSKGDERGPVQFWYVVPLGLVRIDEVPSWAGLIELTDRGASYSTSHWRFSENQTKEAPRLHKKKIEQNVRDHAFSVCYYRMHNLMLGL